MRGGNVVIVCLTLSSEYTLFERSRTEKLERSFVRKRERYIFILLLKGPLSFTVISLFLLPSCFFFFLQLNRKPLRYLALSTTERMVTICIGTFCFSSSSTDRDVTRRRRCDGQETEITSPGTEGVP